MIKNVLLTQKIEMLVLSISGLLMPFSFNNYWSSRKTIDIFKKIMVLLKIGYYYGTKTLKHINILP